VFDVKTTFRNVPTLPEDHTQLTIVWEGNEHFDHAFSFGATIAPDNQVG
jgi:hypothetical protein